MEEENDRDHWKMMLRLKFEIIMLALFMSALWLVPWQPSSTGLQLFLYKVVLFSASQLVAYISRKVMYPYIDFGAETDPVRKGLVLVYHASAAYVFASGG